MNMQSWIVSATSPDKRYGQFLAVDATSARAALEEFHEETDFKMVDWSVDVIPATPTNQETRA